MTKKKRRELREEFLNQYDDIIEHFYVDEVGGWPLVVDRDVDWLLEVVPSLEINKKTDRLQKKKGAKAPKKLLRYFYNQKYAEKLEELDEIEHKIFELEKLD